MRVFSAEHDRLLAQVTWPRYVCRLLPAVSVAAFGFTVLDVVTTTGSLRGIDPPAVALVALAALPGLLATCGVDIGRHVVPWSLLAIVPVTLLYTAGEAIGAVPVTGMPAAYSTSILILVSTPALAALRAPRMPTALVFVVALGGLVAATARSEVRTGLAAWYVALLAFVLVGLVGRANFVTMLQLERARDELARQAVADERRRVARDVHDVVAHTLSVTMLHLTAARLAVERAPERAADALAEAERQGRSGLADLRRVVHLLRGDDGALAPSEPTAEELPDLVAGYRRAGLAVRLDSALAIDSPSGPGAAGGPLSPAVGATIYRLAQESLANAAKHGAGRADVRLVVDGAGARLTVRNPCPSVSTPAPALVGPARRPGTAAVPDAAPAPWPEPGSGLAGMRERVTGLGGTFRAGPASASGGAGSWEVEAFLPRDPA